MADLLIGLVQWNAIVPDARVIPFAVQEIFKRHIFPTYRLIWPDIPSGIACWEDIDWICGPGIHGLEIQKIRQMIGVLVWKQSTSIIEYYHLEIMITYFLF